MRSHPPAIVLDGDQRSALATVRSLGQHSIAVWVAEARVNSLASSSRYCTSAVVYPDPTTEPDAFCRWLEQMNSRFPEAVLLPMTDVTVPLVLDMAPKIQHLLTTLPSRQSYEAVTDKYLLFELARNVGVRVPATATVSKETLGSLNSQSFRYPVVVKPRKSAMRLSTGVAKRAVHYADDSVHLIRTIKDMLLDDEDELLIQERIDGYGAAVFGIYEHGRPRFFFAHRRIREKPPSGGVSVLCESVPLRDEEVAAARRILDSLNWHGVAMIEFKVDTAGHAWLIEINARFWGSLQLAVDSGADFPWLIYQLAMGADPEIPLSYTAGNRLRWWLGDLDNLYARLRDPHWTPTISHKAKSVCEFLMSRHPHTRYEFLRWNDPGPSIAAFRQYISSLFKFSS